MVCSPGQQNNADLEKKDGICQALKFEDNSVVSHPNILDLLPLFL